MRGSRFLFYLFTVVALGRFAANQTIRHCVLLGRRERAINHTGIPELPAYIYTRFVEIVMNLRPTILLPGFRPEGPVVGFLECTSYFVAVCAAEGLPLPLRTGSLV